MAAGAPACLKTTLYAVIAALHTVVEPDEDDLRAILLLHCLATLALAFPFHTSYMALPQTMVSKHANLGEMHWVLTAYAIA